MDKQNGSGTGTLFTVFQHRSIRRQKIHLLSGDCRAIPEPAASEKKGQKRKRTVPVRKAIKSSKGQLLLQHNGNYNSPVSLPQQKIFPACLCAAADLSQALMI
jgi:hypothetical protein